MVHSSPSDAQHGAVVLKTSTTGHLATTIALTRLYFRKPLTILCAAYMSLYFEVFVQYFVRFQLVSWPYRLPGTIVLKVHRGQGRWKKNLRSASKANYVQKP